MARQRLFGWGWLSKLGDWEDIYHSKLEDIEGDVSALAGQYGIVVQVLRRTWWDALKHGCVSRGMQINRKMREYRKTHKWDKP